MKWKDKEEELKKLVAENYSYERIGRLYGVSGAAIKKAALRLGIPLKERRKKGSNEHFNKGTAKTSSCEHCGSEFILYQSSTGRFCSNKCQQDHRRKEYLDKWKNGEENGLVGEYSMSKFVRNYLLEKNNNRCQICGWGERNQYTKKVPLQIHHIDGNCTNNKEENLQVLCPNCHSLTENYGKRNKNATIGRSKYFRKLSN